MALTGLVSRALKLLARRTPPERISYGPVVWGQHEAGVNVTESAALGYAVVFSCVRLIAETIGNLPWHVLKERPTGGSDRITTPPAYKLLQRTANPEMTAGVFRETMLSHALLWGNGYAEIVRDNSNRPSAMWLIHPSMVTPARATTGELVYTVRSTDGGTSTLRAQDVFHLRGLGYDGVVGYSPIEIGARAIGIGLAEDKFAGAFFGNGAWPGGLLKFPGKLTEEQRRGFRESLSSRHQGPEKARKVHILEQGLEWETLSVPNDVAQFIESRKYQILDICRLYRVPPHKVFDLDDAHFNNVTEQNIEFVQDQTPWIRRLEQEADTKLFGERSGGDLFTKINVSALLRGDPERRSKFYETLQRTGIASINELRGWEDLNPIPNGDTHFVASNIQTLERAVKPPAPPPAFGQPPPTPDAPEDDATEDTPDVAPEADLACRDFLADAVKRQLRKEVYKVRAALKAAAGDQDQFTEKLAVFVGGHEVDTAQHLEAPMRAWLRLHGANGDAEELAVTLAAEMSELHLSRFTQLLSGKHDELNYDVTLLDQEGTRVDDLCNLIFGRLSNAIITD